MSVLFFLATFNAFAQFSGYYAPGTWATTINPAGSGGSVSSVNAPTSIDMISGNNNVLGRIYFSRTMPAAGTVTFDWSYTTVDGPQYDWPEYSINGGTPVLMPGYNNNSSASSSQTGTASIPVSAGDVFALIMYTVDGAAGAATTTFSNFTAPAASCLPPTATYSAVPNCASNQYSVDVNVTSLGSATSVNVMVGTTSYGTITSPGLVTAGPFTSGSAQNITLVHNTDPNCNISSLQNYNCPATNDDCLNAITLNVSGSITCTTSVSANNIGATVSSQTGPTCTSSSPTNDVWFSFVATDPNVKIDLTNVQAVNTGNSYNYLGVSVYDGASGCGALTELDCDEYNAWFDGGPGNNPLIVTGLTVSNTYYVRVWASDYDIDPEVHFDICLTTPPPPPANNDCINAVVVSMSPGTCSGPTTPVNTASATMDMPPPPYSCWSSSNDDDVWYTFTTPAGATDAIMNVTNYTYTGGSDPGIGYGLFTSCTGPTDLSSGCQFYPNGSSGSYTFTGLTPNTTYYLALLTPGTGVSIAFDLCLAYTTCPAPTSLNATNLTTTTADLGWTEIGSAIDWEVEYGPSPLTLGSGIRSMTTSNPLSISSLTQNTTYDFYVRSVCGPADSSVWSGPYTFTTIATCPAPTSLNASNITTNSADLDWIEAGSATDWQIEYGTAPLTLGSGTRMMTTSNPITISSLTQSTSYDFYVRAVCMPGDSSTWSGPYNFTTLVSCPAPTALTIGNITANSVDVNWTATGGTEILEYGPTGHVPGTGATAGTGGTIITGVTPPYTITGLSASSGYDVFIRQDCSASSNGFSLNLSAPVATTGAPANDTLCGAYTLTVGSTTPVWVNTTNATVTASDPQDFVSCTGANNSVWYQFTTTTAGVYDITGYSSQVTTTSALQNMSAWAWLYSATGACPSLTLTLVSDLTACSANLALPATNNAAPNVMRTISTPSLAAATTYYLFLDGNSGSYGNIGITVANPLAIKLDKISAVNNGNANRVDWNTLSEERGDRFELERSIDGKSFTRIYEQRANGEASRYTYMDNNAVKGMNHYRLRMVAANGSVTYSETVTAFVRSAGFEVEAFPNPVADELTVKVSGIQGADAAIQVTDLTGKVIQTVKMNGTLQTINMSGLANGIYLIKYSDVNHTQTIKVNKQ